MIRPRTQEITNEQAKQTTTTNTQDVGSLLLDPCHVGRLFVRGVYIVDDPDLATGVDLANIRLDRDRGAVLKKSDLEHQVSSTRANRNEQ